MLHIFCRLFKPTSNLISPTLPEIICGVYCLPLSTKMSFGSQWCVNKNVIYQISSLFCPFFLFCLSLHSNCTTFPYYHVIHPCTIIVISILVAAHRYLAIGRQSLSREKGKTFSLMTSKTLLILDRWNHCQDLILPNFMMPGWSLYFHVAHS